MSVRIKPLGDRILVKLYKDTEVKVAGLTLTVAQGKHGKREFNEDTLKALVLAVGPDVGSDVEVNSLVVIRGDAGRWIGPEIISDAEMRTHRIIEYPEILGVLEQAELVGSAADVVKNKITIGDNHGR